MPRIKQDSVHDTIRDEIKAAARRLMAQDGAQGLSLRAIARELEVTAPALYRYYPKLDDLITALIVDAFDGLAETMQAAQQTESTRARQLLATLRAYQQWALAHPVEYMLIYGTPLPHYEAPREITVPAAVQIFATLVQPIQQALQAGELTPQPPYDEVPAAQQPVITTLIAENNYPAAPLAVYLGFVCWSRLYGTVMPALLGHLVPLDTNAFFEAECAALCRIMGFTP